MMNRGLTQQDRAHRVESLRSFQPMDTTATALLQRMLRIASFVRFHDEQGKSDAYFDELLDSIQQLLAQGQGDEPPKTGEFEPAQALLYALADALDGSLRRFNARWQAFPSWYMDEVLRVDGQQPQADRAYVQMTKGIAGNLVLPAGSLVGSSQRGPAEGIRFRTADRLCVSDISLGRMYKAHLDRERNVFPANVLKAPTAVMVADISHRNAAISDTFASTHTREDKQSIGLQVASPALLLREGRRYVDITFEAEDTVGGGDCWGEGGWFFQVLTANLPTQAEKSQRFAEINLQKACSHVFYLEISTVAGWTPIPAYAFERVPDRLAFTVKFDLSEHFPETIACAPDLHGQLSAHPALKVLLNRDAWLYPLIWLEKFFLSRITICTRVEEITDVQVYNELGKVDNSVPFAPFGINTDRGAWFAVGNYEMASKNTQSMELAITWQQLPMEEGGLAAYYRGYPATITNTAFGLQARYLSDYKWRPIKLNAPLSLFMTDNGYGGQDLRPFGRLAEETVWKGVPIGEMRPVDAGESHYEYGIRAKRGFVSFVLDTPEMGFGAKTYRSLFTEMLVRNTLKRKKARSINPPIAPLVQRMLLSYVAKDEINLAGGNLQDGTALHHIYPLGIRQVYPLKGQGRLPFAYALPTDFNLMFELSGLTNQSEYQLYFEFIPPQKDIGLEDLPEVSWYWGDGYQWQPLPAGVIVANTTRNFMVNGLLSLRFREIPNEGIRAGADGVWLCASITKNAQSIPLLRRVVPHAVQVQREEADVGTQLPAGFVLDMARIPGVSAVKQISAFFGRIESENPQEKLARVSEFISHRGKAITPRDYERLVLQHFPAVRQVMCLPCFDSRATEYPDRHQPGLVTLVVFPHAAIATADSYPYCPPDLLLDIQRFLAPRASAYVRRLDVVNPVYEEIIVRATVAYRPGADELVAQDDIKQRIDRVIAPWVAQGQAPYVGYSFAVAAIDEAIRIPAVSHAELLVYQLIHVKENDFRLMRYASLDDRVSPSTRHGVMVPARQHVIGNVEADVFGIEEMSIDQNFVIYGEAE